MICLGYDETFCLNALEANSCGLPVITFGNTALKEMITHNKNGIIVNDFEEMALFLNSYLNSSMSTIKMFNINSFKYSKRYALKKISNQWIRLLK